MGQLLAQVKAYDFGGSREALTKLSDKIRQAYGKAGELKKGLTARWYHPRTGGWLDAGKVTKSLQSFEPADRNDWLLVFKAD